MREGRNVAQITLILLIAGLCGISVFVTPIASADQTQPGSTEFVVQTVADGEVVQGDTYDVEIQVTNEGDVGGTRTITYEAGSIYREKDMSLNPAETDTWYLTIDSDPLSPGEYQQDISSPSSFDTLPLQVKPGEPNFIVDNLRIEKDGDTISRVEKGASAEIHYAIRNDGEGPGEQYANCYLASEYVGDAFIELESSEIKDGLSCSFNTNDLSPGTYEYGVETDDDSVYRQIIIERPPQPPTITSAFPSKNVRLNAATNDAEEFSIDVSDPDSNLDSLSTEWFIDNESYGMASRLTISAQDLSPGMHTIRAVVNDNQPETESASRQWELKIVTPPRIEERTPQTQTDSLSIEPGDSKIFTVDVIDADTPPPERDISWQIDGQRAGSGTSFDLSREALSTGQHTVSVTVSDGSSLTENARAEWTVSALARPTIQNLKPDQATVTTMTRGESLVFSVDATDPNGEGISRVRWRIAGTEFSGTSTQYTFSQAGRFNATVTITNQAGLVTTKSVEVAIKAPPRIEERTPQTQTDSLSIEPGDSKIFTVDVIDADTPPPERDISWQIDGQRAGSGTSFDLSREALSTGQHTVSVTVSDGSSITETAHAKWTVSALARPTIQNLKPDRATVTTMPGEPTTFSIDATDPNGEGISRVRWRVDGTEFSGTSTQYTFSQVGRFGLTVTVTNQAGLTTTRSVEVIVEATPPNLQTAGPRRFDVDVEEPITLDVEASDPRGRSLSFDYQWRAGSRVIESQQTTIRFDEVGKHEITLIVTNEYGAKTARSYTVRVQNDRPSVTRQSPTDEAKSVLSQNPVSFAADVTNVDSSPATAQLVVDGSTVDEQRMPGESDEQVIRSQYAFQNPGDQTVQFVVQDSHGAEDRVSWDVTVESRPPEIRQMSPSESRLELMSGDTTTFRVSAEDPEGQQITHRWVQDGSTIAAGSSVTQQFNQSGIYNVSVEASDPQGITTSQSWTVNVRSFHESPTNNVHLTNIVINPESERTTQTFLTVAMENPSSNARTVVVEFIIDTPDGLSIVRQRGVDASNKAQVTGIGRVRPGTQQSLRIGLQIADKSLIGSDVPIDVTVRYYPKNQSEDVSYIRESKDEIRVQRPGILSRIISWIEGII